MPLTPELVQQLTPGTPAPGEDDLEKIEDGNRRRRLAWTRYLRSKEFFSRNILNSIPKEIRPWYVGVGLVPTLGFPVEGPQEMMRAIRESRYTWGVVLAVMPFAEAGMVQGALDFENLRFPIIISPISIQLHSLALSSSQNSAVGSRTTWATARATANSPASHEGLLTARHVPGRCGQSQLWSNEAGGNFTEYRRGSTYVDASYLEGKWGNINPTAKTPRTVDLVSSGDQVTLKGAYSTLSGFVTHGPNKNYIGGGSPSHIFLSLWGVSGDSGGLVHDQGDPISMYIGEVTLRDGSLEGLSLSLEQVADDLEVDILI